MFVYNVIFFINFFLGLINIINKKYTKFLLRCSFIILSVFLGFNYMNGIDWVQWQGNFLELLTLDKILETQNYMANIPNRNKSEIIFYYMMIVAKSIGINYEVYQYIVLSIFLIVVYKVFKRYTIYPLFGICFYFTSFMLENTFEPLLRQIMAMIIFYLSLENLNKKKYFKYGIQILMSSLFHSSSAILFSIIVIPFKKIKLKIIIIFFGVAIILTNFINLILVTVAKYIIIFEKYLVYFSIEGHGIENNLNKIFFVKIIFSIFLGWFVQKNKNYLFGLSDNKFYMILNLFWLNELCFIFQRKMIIFFRMRYYFEIFYIIIIVWLIQIITQKYGKKLSLILVLLIGIFYYRIMYIMINSWLGKDSMKFVPYTNYIVELIRKDKLKKDKEKIKYRLYKREEEINKYKPEEN